MLRLRGLSVLALAVASLGGCGGSLATPEATVRPSAAASTPAAGLTVYFEENAQVELIAPSGQRVLIDVADPSLLSSPATAQDILLTTHLHTDHYQADFEAAFGGPKLTNVMGVVERGGVKVSGVDASHSNDPIVPAAPTDHLFVVEIAGFRVVHCGDLGQFALSDDQVAAIGKPDLVFTTLKDISGPNDFGGAGRPYELDLVKQMAPRLVIPTDKDLELARQASSTWAGLFAPGPRIVLTADRLPDRTTILYMGSTAKSFGGALGLKEVDWR